MGNSGSFKLGTPAWNKGKSWSEETRAKISQGQKARPKKTHCKNGHEYTPENTLLASSTGGGFVESVRTMLGLHCPKIKNEKSG